MLSYLSLLLFASTAFAVPAVGGEECGSHLKNQELEFAEQSFVNMTAGEVGGKAPSAAKTGPIDVYWHVIYKDTTQALGFTPQKHITDSMIALNNAFRPSGFQFRLVNTDRTKNAVWWDSLQGSAAQTAMKNALRKGDKTTLNVYTSSIPGLRGYATFPYQYAGSPKLDGVVVEPSTLVGGSSVGYNLGVTLIHEVGHWTGLYHTFQGGCSEPGDYVSDTPQSASSSTSCDLNRDSCPANPGRDPVKNYMDYSPHTCKDRFSPGQITRMKQQMKTYRDLTP